MNLAAAVAVAALTITTQNVRVGMPPPAAHHDIDQAAERSSIVFAQEMGLRRAARFAPDGWGTSHFTGIRRGDCATYWDRKVWHRMSSWTRQLTFASFRAGHRFALVTVLRGKGTTLATVCVHSITKSLSAARRPVFARGMHRLSRVIHLLRYRYSHVVVGGDWNRTWPHRARFKGFRSTEPQRATGAGGGRVDYFYWARGDQTGLRVIGHTRSDHNGVRLHLRWP